MKKIKYSSFRVSDDVLSEIFNYLFDNLALKARLVSKEFNKTFLNCPRFTHFSLPLKYICTKRNTTLSSRDVQNARKFEKMARKIRWNIKFWLFMESLKKHVTKNSEMIGKIQRICHVSHYNCENLGDENPKTETHIKNVVLCFGDYFVEMSNKVHYDDVDVDIFDQTIKAAGFRNKKIKIKKINFMYNAEEACEEEKICHIYDLKEVVSKDLSHERHLLKIKHLDISDEQLMNVFLNILFEFNGY